MQSIGSAVPLYIVLLFIMNGNKAKEQERLALQSAEQFEKGWRRGQRLIDSLPYVDDVTEDEKINIQRMIQEEVRVVYGYRETACSCESTLSSCILLSIRVGRDEIILISCVWLVVRKNVAFLALKKAIAAAFFFLFTNAVSE
jgi:hypothetical protein